MDVREKLVDIVCDATQINGCIHSCRHQPCAMVRGIVDALIEKGVTVQEWISVKDRLPRKEEYTATAKDGEEYYVRLLIAYKTDIIEYEIGYYDGYKWMTEMPIRIIKDVVAWMPFPNLPQPPKGE